MPSKAELMASGLAYNVAGKLGVEPLASVTAAGSSQTTATALVGSFANVTTSLIGSGVKLFSAFDRNFVWNAGPSTLTVYPPTGCTIVGLAQNAGMTLAPNNGVIVEGDGTNLLGLFTN